MSDFEKYLAALMSGDTASLPEPDTNVEKYLAKALGLWDGELPEPKSDADVLLYQLAEKGVGGDDYAITDGRYLFYFRGGCGAVAAILPKCKGLTNAEYMFMNAKLSEEEVALIEKMDFGEVTTANYMFQNSDIVAIDLSRWDTQALVQAHSMFKGCNSLETVSFGNNFGGKLQNIMSMFSSCPRLEEVDLSGLVTAPVQQAQYIFQYCSGLKNIIFGDFKIKSVSMMYAFSGCSALETLDLSSIDTSVATDLSYAFQGCSSLKKLDFSTWDTAKCTSMSQILYGCRALEEIIGFSATNKAGMTITFPTSSSSSRYALKRLTFRTDLDEGQYAIRSAINIGYCNFFRDGMVEMLNTLPDVSGLGLTTAQTTITIKGNPCVSTTVKTTSTSNIEVADYNDFLDRADEYYGALDRTGAQVRLFRDLSGWETLNFEAVDEATFGTCKLVIFNGYTATVPEEEKITDEDRAIATAKGWTLVE